MKPEPTGSLLIRARAAFDEVTADPRRGRHIAEAVAADARAAGDSEARVIALRAAGWAARELYDHGTAQSRLSEAVDLARTHDITERLCEALITRSAMFLELGRPGLARTDLTEAAAVARGPVRGEVAFAQGLLEDKVGNHAAAITAYRRALASLGAHRRDVRVKALNNLALILARRGRYTEAERLLSDAAALAELFSPTLTGIIAESQADVAIAGGRHIEALRRYERAERLLTAVGVQLVDLYLGKATALLTLRLLDEAAEAAAKAVAQVEGRAGGSLMLAEALLPQARIALASDRLDDAVALSARAEALFRRQRRSGWRLIAALVRLSAQARSSEPTAELLLQLDRLERAMRSNGNITGAIEAGLLLGEVAAALGRRRRAAAAFARVARAAATEPALVRLQGRRAAARGAELAKDTRRLGHLCRLGLDELASYRATFASAELRARAAAHGATLAEIGLRAALRTARAEQIWAWVERARSMVFVGGTRQVDERLAPLLAELRATERRLDELPADATAGRATVLRHIAGLEDRIRTASWTRTGERSGWTAPSVRRLRALRHELGDRALLEYGLLDGRLYGISVTRTAVRFVELGPVGDIVASGRHLAFAMRRLSQPRSTASVAAAFRGADESLRFLADRLLRPFGSAVRDATEVIVATPGRLIGIPWGTLLPLRHIPVRVVPSAVAWSHSRRQERTSDRVVLVAGPGVAEGEDEVHAIARTYVSPELYTSDRASCAAVQYAADGARLVHVASHGRLRTDSPTFSSLGLSDGPLTVHDLENLARPAHHWVLAACDLGDPGNLVGEDLEGVLAALLSGGAGAVVAAIVSVPDVPTRAYMVELHRRLANDVPIAEAMRLVRSTVDSTDPRGFVAATAFSCYGGG